MFETIRLVREQTNPYLSILGVVLTMYDKRRPEHRAFVVEMERECAAANVRLFSPVARRQSYLYLSTRGQDYKPVADAIARALIEHVNADRREGVLSAWGAPSRPGGVSPGRRRGDSLRRQVAEMPFNRPILINTESIDPNPGNPRKHFEETALNELAGNMKEIGQLHPCIVTLTEATIKLVAGERRWRAAVRAGLPQVCCIVRPGLSSLDRLRTAISRRRTEWLRLTLCRHWSRMPDCAPLEEHWGSPLVGSLGNSLYVVTRSCFLRLRLAK